METYTNGQLRLGIIGGFAIGVLLGYLADVCSGIRAGMRA